MAGNLIPPTSEAVNPQLDRVATVLIAATAATSSILTLYGLNSDRIWVVLDDNASRWLVIGAGVCALAAVAMALYSYIFLNNRVKTVLVALGALFYVLGLVASVLAAANSSNVQGRASIVDMSITEEDSGLVVSFEVTGSSIDDDERLGVRLLDSNTREILVESQPRATAGSVKLTAKMPLEQRTPALLLQVWTIEKPGETPVCSEEGDRKSPREVIADCLEVGPRSFADSPAT